jgi:hypothetical protein
LFSRMLRPVIGLQGRPGPYLGGCRVVPVGVEALPRLVDDRARPPRIVALARPTAVGGELPLGTEQVPRGAATAGACEPIRLPVALQPDQADTLIQTFTSRNVEPTSMIPHAARWLYMSQ